MSAALLIAAPAAQADLADFYRGKTVEVLVGFSPGGGYDAYARVLARTLGNHIPITPVGTMCGYGSRLRRCRSPSRARGSTRSPTSGRGASGSRTPHDPWPRMRTRAGQPSEVTARRPP